MNYENCLKFELEKNGHRVKSQVEAKIIYDDFLIDTVLKVDLLVDECIVVEIKTVEKLLPVHQAQILTYMKILEKPQGLLINFYTDNVTKSLIPLVNEYFKKLPE